MSQTHVGRMFRIWEKFESLETQDRPDFNEAYQTLALKPAAKRALAKPVVTLVPPDATDDAHHVESASESSDSPAAGARPVIKTAKDDAHHVPAKEHFLKLSPETVAESKEFFAKL